MGIPFVIRGGASLVSTQRMQSFLALLGVLVDRGNDVAMRVCIMEYVLYLGPEYWRRINSIGPDASGNSSLFSKAERIIKTTKIPKNARESLGHFLGVIKGWDSEMGNLSLMELVTKIYTDYVMDDSIKAKAKTKASRKAAVNGDALDKPQSEDQVLGSLQSMVTGFFSERIQGADSSQTQLHSRDTCSPETLQAFLAHVSMMSGSTEDQGEVVQPDGSKRKLRPGEGGADAVVISTVHQAKGLEWEHVFLPHFNECLFPMNFREENKSVSERLNRDPEESRMASLNHYREEGRLAYVAITRAKRGLNISVLDEHPLFWMKKVFGHKPKPSRYLPAIMSPAKKADSDDEELRCYSERDFY
ncbi:hypothetical protein FBU59_006301 [Linderina macrospora]|uniref:Uncharacterized protein n=1 Tax=Linderina macrospora TaxID=4868 RepID=A0ACC1J094_9FUNG|nr:hypothetical protein FBU59_006301 [Linderina macrospora]